MTEADVIQPSASIASTGPGIRYIGAHCYSYSGEVSVGTDETTITEFDINGQIYIIGSWQPQILVNTTDDQFFKLYLNDQLVSATILTSSKDYSPFEEIEIIIPSGTSVKITGENLGSGSKNLGTVFTGRVYGAE